MLTIKSCLTRQYAAVWYGEGSEAGDVHNFSKTGAGNRDLSLRRAQYMSRDEGTIQPTSTGGLLLDAADDTPFGMALTEARSDGTIGRSWTYAELREDATRVAQCLLAHFDVGDRVAVWAPNTPEWVILQFAAALSGLTLVTVNTANTARELEYVLRQSRCTGLFFAESFRGNPMADIAQEVCSRLKSIKFKFMIAEGALETLDEGMDRDFPCVDPHAPAQIQYTSGTTGAPKGAVLSHRSITNNARLSFQRFGARRGDTLLNMMPMFHTSGCGLAILGSLQHRCRVVLAKQFDPLNMNALIEREQVHLMMGVPTMLLGMLDAFEKRPRDVSTLRSVMTGGANVPPDLVDRVQDKFECEVTIIYGQTEASPGITQTRNSDSRTNRTYSVGQALPCTEVAVKSLETGEPLNVGELGEICARGYCVMNGYFDDTDSTRKAIDSEGWLHTGDIGTIDEQGFVRVTGRLKEMIIRGGENIYPAEIEGVVLAHPGVIDAAVIGVPDEVWGEKVVCFIVGLESHSLLASELVSFVRRELAAPKTPAHWIVVDEFPLTASGKVQKFIFRERFLAGEYKDQEL